MATRGGRNWQETQRWYYPATEESINEPLHVNADATTGNKDDTYTATENCWLVSADWKFSSVDNSDTFYIQILDSDDAVSKTIVNGLIPRTTAIDGVSLAIPMKVASGYKIRARLVNDSGTAKHAYILLNLIK